MRFEKIYIELSDFCGLKCGFCPNATRQKKRGRMDIELFSGLCSEIKGKAKRVCFHILGDPLGVEISQYAAIARVHGLKIELVTTGLFLKKEHFGLLLGAPFVQVAFSLSAFVANPRVLGVGHLEQILKLCDESIRQGAPLFINLRFHSADIATQSALYKQMLEIIAEHFHLCAKQLDKSLRRGERVRLGKKVFLNPTKSFEWEKKSLEESLDSEFLESEAFTCYGAIGQIGILSDGRVVPCCIDYEGRAAFGSLREAKLGEILNSPRFKDFTTKMKQAIIPHALCQKCGYWRKT